MQRDTVEYSVWHFVAVWCRVLQDDAMCCSVISCAEVCYYVLQRVVVRYSGLQCDTVCWSVM